MFRAGSPYTSWRQVGFADEPLTISGPSATGAGFSLFGDLALGRQGAALADLRSDYHAFDTELEVKTDVVGTDDDIEQAAYRTSRQQAVTALRKEVAAARSELAAGLSAVALSSLY